MQFPLSFSLYPFVSPCELFLDLILLYPTPGSGARRPRRGKGGGGSPEGASGEPVRGSPRHPLALAERAWLAYLAKVQIYQRQHCGRAFRRTGWPDSSGGPQPAMAMATDMNQYGYLTPKCRRVRNVNPSGLTFRCMDGIMKPCGCRRKCNAREGT